MAKKSILFPWATREHHRHFSLFEDAPTFALEKLSRRGSYRVFDPHAAPGGDYRVLRRIPSSKWTRQKIEITASNVGPDCKQKFSTHRGLRPIRRRNVRCSLSGSGARTFAIVFAQFAKGKFLDQSLPEIIRLIPRPRSWAGPLPSPSKPGSWRYKSREYHSHVRYQASRDDRFWIRLARRAAQRKKSPETELPIPTPPRSEYSATPPKIFAATFSHFVSSLTNCSRSKFPTTEWEDKSEFRTA